MKEIILPQLIDDVRWLLGEVQYSTDDANQKVLLQKKYFIDLVNLISTHVKKDYIEEFKKAYNVTDGLLNEVRRFPKETMFTRLSEKVLEIFRIPRTVFMDSSERYTNEPDVREQLTSGVVPGKLAVETSDER